MKWLILVALLLLLGLVMKFVVLVRQLDQAKVARYCSDPPSIKLKKGEFSDMIKITDDLSGAEKLMLQTVKTYLDASPPADTEIKFNLSC